MRRKHPTLGRELRRWDVREDGFVFQTYTSKLLASGFYKEVWLSPEAAERARLSQLAARDRWFRERSELRRKMVDDYKVARGCAECGYNAHPHALDFDHISPAAKEFTIGTKKYSVAEDKLWREIRKCRILCANCHRIHTANQNEERKK